MNRGFGWRLALMLIATGSLVPLFLPSLGATFSFDIEAQPGIGYVVGEAAGLPFPDELRRGDVLAIDQMTTAARAALIGGNSLTRGLRVPIVVWRDGASVPLTAPLVADDSASATVNRLSNIPLMLSILALALVTLWRGRDWTAWGLMLFSVGICIKQFDIWPAPPLASFWIETASRLLMWLVAIPGLYVTAETLVRSGLSLRTRRVFRLAFIVSLLLLITLSLGKTAATVFWGWTGWIAYKSVLSVIGPLSFFVPLFLLVGGYRGSDGPQRLRIRWVLWSTGLLGATFVAFGLLPTSNLYARGAIPIVQALSFFGYLYAVLRHRLVDVSFIVDRALVYGVTTSLVVGAFAILENFIEQAAVGNDAGFLLQAAATLLLALLLNRVHRRVESIVEKLFFRRQRRAAHELRRFAQQCAFIEQHDRLLSLTAERIDEAIAGSGVSIYERRDGTYLRLIQRGDTPYPATVDVDDLALIGVRASLQATDLDALGGSAFGNEGCLFPMALRGRLLGVIVCGPRRGEQFAPDERTELAKLAQEVGIALYLLRAREHEQFVAAVASGEMDDAQGRARRLLPTLSSYGAG